MEKFQPEVGQEYRNRSGGVFQCLYAEGDTAELRNLATGWQFVAHGCQQYEDNSIEWDYSAGGRFVAIAETAKPLSFDDILNVSGYGSLMIGNGTYGSMEILLTQTAAMSDAELGKLLRAKIIELVPLYQDLERNSFYDYLKRYSPALLHDIQTQKQSMADTMEQRMSSAVQRATQTNQQRAAPVQHQEERSL